MKICPQCKIEKFENEFHKNNSTRWKGDEYSSWCKVCNRRRHRDRYDKKRKEVLLDKKLKWKIRPVEQRLKRLEFTREYNRKNRLIAIEKYGGKCICCGEDEIKFLEIDHINNDGAKHRRDLGSSRIIGWLKKENYPEGFQILCSNCNMAKGRYGECPHIKNII